LYGTLKPALDAAKKIDKQLDFVYIDGLHDFKSVIDDIAAWYPLVRKGGVVGGHDFTIQGEGGCSN
jgi:predicted O-methyltransferase YrrM